MRENYGLYSLWDINNNCFVASSPDFELCRGRGETHAEAVVALDVEVQVWIETGRTLGLNVSYAPAAAKEQPPVSAPPPQSQEAVTEKPQQGTQKTQPKALKKALAAAQKAALSAVPLDYTIALDPCVIRIRGELSRETAAGARDEILGLASQHDSIIFDLSEVDFIDSFGLTLLVEVRKKFAEVYGNGSSPTPRSLSSLLSVVVPTAEDNQVARVLYLGRFDTIMSIVASLEEAKAVLQESEKAAS